MSIRKSRESLNKVISESETSEGSLVAKNLIDMATAIQAKEKIMYDLFRKNIAGKQAIIKTQHYNGQPAGRSKPNLSGKTVTIDPNWVHYDNGKLYVTIVGKHAAISLDELEIVN